MHTGTRIAASPFAWLPFCAALLALHTFDAHAAGTAESVEPSAPSMGSMEGMPGMLGPYPMTRESSGTSWQPDSSPVEAVMGSIAGWHSMLHGSLFVVSDHQGGPRGGDKTFVEGMFMAMAQRPVGDAELGLRAMVSPDPAMGPAGYPLLLQTGESADGHTPLVDRQHPHNLFMELAATVSTTLGEERSAYLYAGLPGEPALGPPAFMHRLSSSGNPEAPIGHHWLDSTHITNGVVTAGYAWGRAKLEASAFHGREPDEHRARIEPGRLDSFSARAWLNPTPSWSLQASYGRITSPEALEPDHDVRRTTLSASLNFELESGPAQATIAWGRNAVAGHPSTDAYLLEAAGTFADVHTLFGRLERVDKDELFAQGSAAAGQAYTVAKLTLGYVRDFGPARWRIGLGGLASAFALPRALEPSYGRRPLSVMLFARVKIG